MNIYGDAIFFLQVFFISYTSGMLDKKSDRALKFTRSYNFLGYSKILFYLAINISK